MATITINGQQVDVRSGTILLQAIHEIGLSLPTLCHLDGLPPYGACRLCLVEVSDPDGSKEVGQVVAACTYPVEEGLIVNTNGQRARLVRKMVLEFMLARCPGSPEIRSLAAEAGLMESRFPTNGQPDELCVLCGLCVRVCRDLIGAAAIGPIHRGPDRAIGPPFMVQAEACIGCMACVAVCPTKAIKVEDRNGQRIFHTWNTTVPLYTCPNCGKPSVPEPMEFLKGQVPVSAELWGLCPSCRRQQAVNQLDLVRDVEIHL